MPRFFLKQHLWLKKPILAIRLIIIDILAKRQFPHSHPTRTDSRKNLTNTSLNQTSQQSARKTFRPKLNGKKSQFRASVGIVWFGLALTLSLLVGLGLPFQTPVDAAHPAVTIQLPLSTQGPKIIDATGKPVLLRGVNWFGIETDKHAPHGLWKRDYKEMLAQIKSLGYNIIRLPYSVESLRALEVSGVDYSIGSNQELYDKSPLEVMDAIIQEAARQQLLILLDSHRLNDQKIPELWYGDGYKEEDWIDTWKMLASRYRNQPNVIGADLKNEPHGRASWGTDDLATDWRLAAERAGNAILAINPNWLIFVEGVENNVPGQKLENHWQGGNLEGVRRYPVRLSRPNKVVYSPHEYGPGVFDHSWFSESSFPNNLSQRWEIGWHYIAKEGIAPVWIGEFGGRQTDKSSKEGVWQRQLVDYIRKNKLGFAYWSWNPNSQDTGGILQEDWSGVETAKQELIQELLIATNFSPSSIAMPSLPPLPRSQPRPNVRVTRPTPKPEFSSPVSRSSQPQLQVRYSMQSDWQEGFCANMQVTNRGNSSVRDWQLSFKMNQAAINNSWNGNFRTQGSQYVVTPLDWGRVIEPGQSRELGFCANKLGSDYQPQQVSVTTIKSNSNSQKGSALATKADSFSKAQGSQLKLTSDMHSNWQEGFCLSMQLSNTGKSSVKDWRVKFQMEQAAVNNTWNGNFQSLGSQYTVTPPDWGKVIEPGQSRELGFCANKLGTNYQPVRWQVEG